MKSFWKSNGSQPPTGGDLTLSHRWLRLPLVLLMAATTSVCGRSEIGPGGDVGPANDGSGSECQECQEGQECPACQECPGSNPDDGCPDHWVLGGSAALDGRLASVSGGSVLLESGVLTQYGNCTAPFRLALNGIHFSGAPGARVSARIRSVSDLGIAGLWFQADWEDGSYHGSYRSTWGNGSGGTTPTSELITALELFSGTDHAEYAFEPHSSGFGGGGAGIFPDGLWAVELIAHSTGGAPVQIEAEEFIVEGCELMYSDSFDCDSIHR